MLQKGNSFQIDNLIVITEQNVEDNLDSFLLPFRTRYRKLVNRDLLYVEMYVGKAPARNVSQHHKNDIFVSGVSEQVLQYIAEFGNGAQLQHISAIDKAYGLHKIPVFVENVPKAKGSENAEAGIEESSNEEENSFEESPRKSIRFVFIECFWGIITGISFVSEQIFQSYLLFLLRKSVFRLLRITYSVIFWSHGTDGSFSYTCDFFPLELRCLVFF